ncbi:MAG: AMP-dependent synthetase/ligase [Balneolaceae bacterium]
MSNDHLTLPELLNAGLHTYPEGIFSSTKRDGVWKETDVATFKEQVRYAALGLWELGVRKGTKVSIHSENSTEWVMLDLAILSMGAVNVPIYTTQHGDQIKYILEDSGCLIHIVSTDQLFKDTKPLMKGIECVKKVISIRGSAHKSLMPLTELLELGQKLDKEQPALFETLQKEVRPDDLATLIYTSGTTGMPKGVMLTHYNIASNVEAALEKLPFPAGAFHGKAILSYLPLSHVFERMIEYMYISMGCRIYYIEHVDEIRDDMAYIKPFFMATVPRLMEKIHTGVKVKGQELSGIQKQLYYWAIYRTEQYDPEHPPAGLEALKHRIADKLIYSKIRALFGGNLAGVVSGGAALPPEIFKFMNAIGVVCVQGYGLTETSPVITVQYPGAMRIGSSGKPIRDVEVKIAENGEICARGPNIMQGYYNKPEQSNEVLTDDGWFKTGDIGRIDEDGFLFITDRIKSMFKLSTGKYVSPQHIEGELSGSGFIEQVVVVGFQKKFCAALVVPAYANIQKKIERDEVKTDGDLTKDPYVHKLIEREIEKANQQLSPWERVKKFVLLREPLTIEAGELTPTLKVKRSVVRERYQKEIDSMYAEE